MKAALWGGSGIPPGYEPDASLLLPLDTIERLDQTFYKVGQGWVTGNSNRFKLEPCLIGLRKVAVASMRPCMLVTAQACRAARPVHKGSTSWIVMIQQAGSTLRSNDNMIVVMSF
jgi:hypothetical protein